MIKTPFKKTKKEQFSVFAGYTVFGVIILLLSLWYIFATNNQTPEAASVNYESVVIAHIMWFKLKVALGLVALGTLLTYLITYIFSHSPIGRWFHFDEKDDSSMRSAKIVSLGITLASILLGVFILLGNIIGK